MLRWLLVAIVLASALVGGWLARGGSSEKPPAIVHDVPWLDGKWIRYSETFAERSKIAFGPVEQGALSPLVAVTGTVSFDPERVAAIGARIPGRIRRVYKLPGDAVRHGEAIADLESADLGEAQAMLVAARAHEEAARANDERQQQLLEARIAAARDAEAARATARAAHAEVVAAEQRIRAFGGAAEGEIGILTLRSPIEGKVVELGVSRGQSVEPSHTAARVADLRRVWIELAVFERELGRVAVGDEVEISPQTDQQTVVQGKVAHVGDVIDLDTRSAPVRVVVDNVAQALRPGQSVLAKIHVKNAVSEALLLPREAVVSIDGRTTVFVAHDATSVEPRVVELGASDGARVEIRSGIEAGERVATKGVFALKSEVFR